MMRSSMFVGLLLAASTAVMPATAAPMTLQGTMAYPFISSLVASSEGKAIGWVREVAGVRNIWVAGTAGDAPKQVTAFTEDDGQELTQLTFAPDGKSLLFVRGGDHDGNWTGTLAPNPAANPEEPKVMLWRANLASGSPAQALAECDAPAVSATGTIVCLKAGQVWQVGADGKGFARLFFDRGRLSDLVWSPDGSKLAFTSRRDGHALIGIYAGGGAPVRYLSASSGVDGKPVWSPDGAKLAFTRRWPGLDGYGRFLDYKPQPWAIMVGDAASGAVRQVWASGTGLRDSFPDVAGGANLHWTAGDRLLFLSAQTNWQQLYSVPASGGDAMRLTGDGFMVEHVSLSPDRATVFYSANTGATKDDDTRRHVFSVKVTGGPVAAVTSGTGLEWTPAATQDGVALIAATQRDAGALQWCVPRCQTLPGQMVPADFAGAAMVVPEKVTWQAPDGQTIHGQLFKPPGGSSGRRPAVIFVHGGPPRQMLLGFSSMRYYANAYALNQYLAARGFVVLSVNYRLGIGYGWDFQHPADGGPRGAGEYQDVLSAAKWLQGRSDVDAGRIGIWGGSYGGLLTAQALARNSDVFKAGVDIHGVHDWSRTLIETLGTGIASYGDTERERALRTAWTSSPIADVDGWRSPALLIHGDDDRNVRINQTIALASELRRRGVPFEELIIPNEIHDFLRHAGWAQVNAATAEFLERHLNPDAPSL
jgi:dipeptidyl aminopeptidase/acylaminoacyl peptidase